MNDDNLETFRIDGSLFAFNYPVKLSEIPAVEDDMDFLGTLFQTYVERDTLKLEHEKQAVLAYYSNGPMLALERTVYDLETRKHLNKYGLKIFLTEPISSHIIDDPNGEHFFHNFNFGFYSEFPNEELDTKRHRAKELDSIFKHVRENALTNVTVHTCDYNIDNLYPLYEPYMKLVCDDLFLRGLVIYDNVDFTEKKEITKKFICTNWRYTSARCLTSAFMQDKDAYVSWQYNVDSKLLEKTAWATKEDCDKYVPGLYDTLINRIEKLNAVAPLCVDIPASQSTKVQDQAGHYFPEHCESKKFSEGLNPVAINEQHQPLDKLYKHTFCSVVTESRFAQPTSNYSEKVYWPMQYKTPFIMVAPPYTLQYMKEMGFKTFDKWWDESYDTTTNHLQRFKKICDLIDYIETLSYDELFEMHKDMYGVLEHNLNNMIYRSMYRELAVTPEERLLHTWDSEWSRTQFDQEEHDVVPGYQKEQDNNE